MSNIHDERSPLLRNGHGEDPEHKEVSEELYELLCILLTVLQQIKFSEDDPESPRSWTRKAKMTNVAVIASMASKPVPFPKSSDRTAC